ncbi:unnamed protein product [Musa acuminata var. zebrina]
MQEGEVPSPKKQSGGSRTTKNKQSPSKHPQGAAAKNALGFFKILCQMGQRCACLLSILPISNCLISLLTVHAIFTGHARKGH